MNSIGVFSTRTRVTVVVVAVALFASGCGGAADGSQTTAADLVHIHGLQEMPGGDGLYVATHTGLFKVDDKEVEPVGAATHDLMGFTVAGPDDLLASGHPDLRDDELVVDDKPPLLGLVHSTDGETWKPLSLLGDVDFHSLVAAHGQVYGLDSQTGALMVSADRKTWETRSEELPFVDFAVSPEDADLLVATTQSGTARSDDGGRSWTDVSNERVLFLNWTSDGVFGASPEGSVLRSDGGGDPWESLGRVDGSPEAFLVSGDAVYVAVADAGIMRSTDGGETFRFLVQTSNE